MAREPSKKYGDKSEDLATSFLQKDGFVILERNYFARKLGEIDIIATKDNILHFIEVKSARADFDPIYNITPSKLRKVINSANYYLKVNRLNVAFTIDAIIIRNGDIEFIENLTI